MAVRSFATNNLVKEHDIYVDFIKKRTAEIKENGDTDTKLLFYKNNLMGECTSSNKTKLAMYFAVSKWHCITLSYDIWYKCVQDYAIDGNSTSYKKFVDVPITIIKDFKKRVNAAIEDANCDYNKRIHKYKDKHNYDACRYLAMFWTYLDIIKDNKTQRFFPTPLTYKRAAEVFGYTWNENLKENPFIMNGKFDPKCKEDRYTEKEEPIDTQKVIDKQPEDRICRIKIPIEKTNNQINDQQEEKKSVDVTVVPQEIPIRDLNLSGNAYNPLYRHGIRTLGDILELTPNDILHIRNVGTKIYREIAKMVEGYGYFYPNKNVCAQPIGSSTVKSVAEEPEKSDYQTEYLRVLSETDALKAAYTNLQQGLLKAKDYAASLEATIRKLTIEQAAEDDDILRLITNAVRVMKTKKMDWLYLTLDDMTIDIHTKESVDGRPRVSYTIRTREE